jgi:hypothetical protein
VAYANPIALAMDGLDDPLVFDVCSTFAGGMVSNVRANLLKDGQSPLLVNCEISRTGEVSTRRGSVRLGAGTAGTGTYVQGLTYFETPGFNYPVSVNGEKLYSFDGTNWNAFAAAFSASNPSNRVWFAQGINKLYFAELGVGHLYSWDGTTLTDEGATDTNTDPPRAPTWLTWHTNRLVASGGPSLPDTLDFSQFLNASAGQWDRTKWSLRVGGGEGDAITGHYSWSDFNLIVWKRHSIYIVNCDPSLQISNTNNDISGFQIKCVHRRIGCVAPATAAQVGSDVFFLSDSGVRSIKRTLATETQTEASDAISLPVQDIIGRINLAAINTAHAVFYDNKYILALPLDNATSPNYLLIYSVLNQSWSGLWTGWLPTAFAIRNVASNVGRLIFGQSDGTVNEFLSYVTLANETDSAFQDNGVDIPVTVLTRALTFDEHILRKEGFNAEFEFNQSTAMAVVQVIIDGGGSQAFESFVTVSQTVTLPQILPFILPTAGVVRSSRDLQRYGLFRELQFNLTTTKQKLVLRSISASAFLNPMIIQSP